MRVEVKYVVELPSEKLAEAVRVALQPDTKNLPEACISEVDLNGRILILRISCSNISKLRALSNSFIGVLASLLRVVGDVQSVGGKASGEVSATRGSATHNAVSNPERTSCKN